LARVVFARVSCLCLATRRAHQVHESPLPLSLLPLAFTRCPPSLTPACLRASARLRWPPGPVHSGRFRRWRPRVGPGRCRCDGPSCGGWLQRQDVGHGQCGLFRQHQGQAVVAGEWVSLQASGCPARPTGGGRCPQRFVPRCVSPYGYGAGGLSQVPPLGRPRRHRRRHHHLYAGGGGGGGNDQTSPRPGGGNRAR
jgi:hypothetical protein